MSTPVTRLWHIEPNGKRRLMSTISESSTFFSFKAPKDLHLEKQRTKCAEIIRDGWVQNGGLHQGSWEIEQGKSDPVVFSEMTNDILRRSRENIGVH